MSEVSIRSSTPFDYSAIVAIERACPTAAHWNEEIYQQMWGNPESDRVAFVAEADGSMVGFLVARDIVGEWELENVAVANDARRQGIGTALLRHLFDRAARAGSAGVFLEVRESNLEARKLYEGQGFQLVGRRNRYYAGPEEDALLFEKKFEDLSMKIR